MVPDRGGGSDRARRPTTTDRPVTGTAAAVMLVVLAGCGATPDYRHEPILPPLTIDAQLPAAPTTIAAPATASAPARRLLPVMQLTETLPPPPPAGPPSARCPQWWAEARAVGWPEAELAHMDRIMWRESRCQPGARNRSGAAGLMQVMPMWAPRCGVGVRQLLEPRPNLACALLILNVQGWQAWSL
jgi:hypothetical protein